MDDLEPVRASLASTRDAFEASVSALRPQLHRYCSRMLGSVIDGEDAVQDTLAQAFFGLPTLKEQVPMKAWLFRIAHNRCVDLLRARRPITSLEATGVEASIDDPDPVEREQLVAYALRVVVTGLPPKERTCLILKDVLDHSLAEIAAIVDSTENGVKAALHRARAKLAAAPATPQPRATAAIDRLALEYVALFNAKDWEGVRALMKADARLEVVPIFSGRGPSAFEGIYFRNYGRMADWKLQPALVNDQPEIVSWRRYGNEWRPWSVVRITVDEGRIAVVRDYHHVEYLLDEAPIEPVSASAVMSDVRGL